MMVVGSISLILALELATVGWPASSLRRLLRPRRSEMIDLLTFALFASGFTGLAVTVCTLGVSTEVDRVCRIYLSHRPLVDTGSDIANIVAYLVVADFATYWLHRLQHMKPLWWFHKLHHSAERLNPLVAHRVNPADLAFIAVPRALALLVVAPSVNSFAIATAVNGFHSLLVHSGLPWTYGGLGRFLLSPVGHQIHHSMAPQHRDKNFAGISPIWDRMFGTWASPDYTVLNGVAPGVP